MHPLGLLQEQTDTVWTEEWTSEDLSWKEFEWENKTVDWFGGLVAKSFISDTGVAGAILMETLAAEKALSD